MENEIKTLGNPFPEGITVKLMTLLNKKKESLIRIVDKFTINFKKIKTVKSLKYYIIDKYPKNNLCPCILSISVPFEDGYYCSDINDKPENNLDECLFEGNIYIIIDFDKECDCGFKSLENISKREIYEIYTQEINKLKQLLESQKNEKDEKLKELEEINNDILINYDKEIEKNKSTIFYEDSNIINERKYIFNLVCEDFYDIIIDIKSIKGINEGWKIKMNKKGELRYNDYKKMKTLVIGVIGNANKGKSFFLSKLSKIELPAGTSIRTEGLSIKYPELEKYKNRKMVLLDSEGLESPLLLEKDKLNKEDINDLNELLLGEAREKLMTELFLQKFIIYNSDILIAVVGILTYPEQKLLNRIRVERNKSNKTLFIIHNLMTFEYISQIEQYINNYLLKDATFDLKKKDIISTKIGKVKDVPYFYEKNIAIKIFHLIYAKEGSEAGKFYNDFALNFLENSYQDVIDIKPFDVIERLKDTFLELSNILFDKSENNTTINENDFLDNKNIIKEKNFRLVNKKNIIFKRYYIDELGFSNLRNHKVNPHYNYYRTEDKFIIRIEAAGNVEANCEIVYSSNLTMIQIKGKKWKDKEPKNLADNFFNSREYGNFFIEIPLMDKLKNVEPTIIKKQGVLIIEYELDKKENNTAIYIYESQDEI